MKVHLPDGTELELEDGATGADAARAIGAGLARAALGIRMDGDLRDLDLPLEDGAKIEIVTARDDDGLWLIRHDAAHVLAAAVMELYPGVKISIGPPIEDGFYYDFDFPDGTKVSEDDFEAIEAKMRQHIKADEHFEREDVSVAEAIERFRGEGQDYKVELIEDLVKDADPAHPVETVSLYRNGPFTDLCRGPHGPGTKDVKAFKLTSVAGAYWRGDADRQMLTRIYGTAWPSKEQLEEHVRRLEEARERDHRKLGRELDLFLLSDLSPGSPFWLPHGTHIWNELTKLWRTTNVERGYQEVRTPILYDVELWKQSGHWHVYRDNMYFTDVEDRPMGLKPMNCPAHVQIYKRDLHSYRDLPIRYAEQGLVHRHEPSGTLHGLLRVRHITQDDAHVFCREDQIEEEVVRCLDFGFFIYDQFGLEPRLELSTRPEKRVGTEEMWDKAEAALQQALENQGLEYDLNEGDGAFYGPKIDLHMTDAIGRSLAARHGPVRLLHAGAVRAHLHGRGQPGAPAGDDPPRPDGRLRALHRDPDRALRRRVPALAGARAGARAADRRPPHRLRARGGGAAHRGGHQGRSGRPHGVDRQEDPRRGAEEGPLHAGGGRSGAVGRHRFGPEAPRGRPRSQPHDGGRGLAERRYTRPGMTRFDLPA